MAELFAIDIHDNLITGVLLEQGTKVSIVKGYGASLLGEREFSEAIEEVAKQVDFKGCECRVAIDHAHCSFRSLSLPFKDKSKIKQVLPFELDDQFSLDSDSVQLDFIINQNENQGAAILAAMVNRGEFVDTLASMQMIGVNPDIITISGVSSAVNQAIDFKESGTFLFLDIYDKHTLFVLVENGKISLVRSLAVNFDKQDDGADKDISAILTMYSANEGTRAVVKDLVQQVRRTLLSVQRLDLLQAEAICFVSGRVGLTPDVIDLVHESLGVDVQGYDASSRPLLKVEHNSNISWNPAVMGGALALALYKNKENTNFNFRTGDFRKQMSFGNIQKIATMALLPLCLIIILGVGGAWWEYAGLEKKHNALKAQIHTVFKETLPQKTKIVNPVQQLQVAIDEAKETFRIGGQNGDSMNKVELLAEISSRLPKTLPILITRYIANYDDVRIKAETNDFNTVDNVKKELDKSDFFSSVNISSANLAPKGGMVRFELKLELK